MKKGFVKTLSKSAADIRLFPLKNVLRRYDKHKLGCDLKAGAGVAMLSFSMSIAYAMIAGLPIKYGLFGCIAAAAVSGVFSSSRFIMFGPSNASAVMLMSAFASLGLVTEEQRAGAAAAIVLLVGVFLALASVFKITNLARYISRTVVTGYITAGAMLIIANQSANALGISGIKNSGGKFIATSEATLRRLDEANWQAVAVAAAAVITLFACKKFFKKLPAQAMALIVPSAICALIGLFRELDLAYINSISVSDWGITLPNFEAAPIRSVVFASAAVAMFCVIESTSIGKSLAAKSAERLNTNQEIFSLGLANIAASALSGTVESGSLTRSAAAFDAGAKTTIVNFVAAAFMLAGVLLFGKFIGCIPKAALSAVVIAIAFSLFSKKALRLALKSTLEDRAVFLLTFITGIAVGLDDAIYVGVAASIVLFLKKASAPEVVEIAIGDDGKEQGVSKSSRRETEISIVHIGGNLFFGASDVFQEQIRLICESPKLKVLLLKLSGAINFDATCAGDLEEISKQMKRRGGVLYLCEVRPDIMKILKASGVSREIGEGNIFAYTPENTTLSAALALRSAKKHLTSGGGVQIIV